MFSFDIKRMNIPFFILICLLFTGSLLRTFIWLHSGCFWADEGCLLFNISNRNYAELFMPLSYVQCTPPVFSIIGKIFLSIFGLNHTALKFIPYIASVFAIFLFVYLAGKVLKNKVSILLASIIFIFHQELLFYTQAFKQYSFDIFFAVLILSFVLYIKNHNISDKNWLVLGICSILCFFSSYTSIILIGVIAFIYTIYLIKNKYFGNFKSFLFFLMPSLTGFLIYFFSNCLPAVRNEGLQSYWHTQEIFFPFDISSFKSFIYFLAGGGEYFYSFILLILLFFSGLFFIYKEDKFLFSFFSLTFAAAILLGLFSIYPLAPSRVSAYLIPFFILITVKPCDIFSYSGSKFIFYKVLILFSIIFAFSYRDIFLNVKSLLNSRVVYKQSNACFFVKKLYESDISKEDYVYLDLTSQVIFELYDTEERILPEQIIYSVMYDGSIEKRLNSLPFNKNIFFFISDDYLWDNQFELYSNWIKENCKIINSQQDIEGMFIKCKKIK